MNHPSVAAPLTQTRHQTLLPPPLPKILLSVWLLSFGFGPFFAPSRAYAAPNFSLSPSTLELAPNQTASLSLNIDTENYHSSGADAIITYNPNVIEVTGINTDSGAFADYPAATTDNSSGRLYISGIVASKNEFVSGTALFATISLKAKTTGTTIIKFDFTPGSTTDSNIVVRTQEVDVLAAVTNTTITVSSNGSDIPAPTTPPSPTPVTTTSTTTTTTTITKTTKTNPILNFFSPKPTATPTLDPLAPIEAQAPKTDPELLDQNNLAKIVSTPEGESRLPSLAYVIGIPAILLFIILLVIFFLKRRRGPTPPATPTPPPPTPPLSTSPPSSFPPITPPSATPPVHAAQGSPTPENKF